MVCQIHNLLEISGKVSQDFQQYSDTLPVLVFPDQDIAVDWQTIFLNDCTIVKRSVDIRPRCSLLVADSSLFGFLSFNFGMQCGE